MFTDGLLDPPLITDLERFIEWTPARTRHYFLPLCGKDQKSKTDCGRSWLKVIHSTKKKHFFQKLREIKQQKSEQQKNNEQLLSEEGFFYF